MFTVKNNSNYTLDQVSRIVIESFGACGGIVQIAENTLQIEHNTYVGKYYFTGSNFYEYF